MTMLRRTFLMAILFVGFAMLADASSAQAQVCNNCMNGTAAAAPATGYQGQAFGRQWAYSRTVRKMEPLLSLPLRVLSTELLR